MRRWFLILLLVLLPLQSVWAEAAAYCQHEGQLAGDSTSHWGHHEHDHGDAPLASGDDASSAWAGVDVDCNVCHAGGAVPFPAWQNANAAHWAGALPARHPSALPTRALAPPDKPNWAAAA
ncbi:MAG: hypothetical protein QE290_05540 [Acidovorax sp.]|uniref:hypothetical protein n=1 Tax=Acidovorax sp. TaxID=1872122 RepID=UPI0026269647|nr:hypothetical protein [Acidovorax sp.]MDH4463487.1 hypothetical protein [Acidovorax sp.]